MRYLANGRQMKAADQYTIQELGIPSMELMERAALKCVEVMEAHRTEETRSQMRLLKETGADICNEYKPGEYSIIIDAIFGVGLSREIIGRYLKVIRQMNEADAVKFAVDIPSGVSADEGCIL